MDVIYIPPFSGRCLPGPEFYLIRAVAAISVIVFIKT